MTAFKYAHKVLIVGTVDVDARIELMRRLNPAFHVSALGTVEDLKGKFAEANLPYHSYQMSRQANPLSDLKSFLELVRIFSKLRPDIVHTFDTKPCVWGRIAARVAKVPIIVGTITGLGTLYVDTDKRARVLRAIYQPLQRLACHCSDLTIFYNHDDLAQFVKAGVAPRERCVVVLGSGIATNQFQREIVPLQDLLRVREDIRLMAGEIVVIMIARLCRSKGVLDFAKAAHIVRSKLPGVRFVLVGPLDKQALDRLSTQEMDYVCNAVTWLGERKDIAAILAAADIFVLPTYREGIPRVLMEAASMRLPIIATDAPGCKEIVHQDLNGLLVPINDFDTLAQSIERLAVDEYLRTSFGVASQKLAKNEFDIDIIAKKIASLYNRCIKQVSL